MSGLLVEQPHQSDFWRRVVSVKAPVMMPAERRHRFPDWGETIDMPRGEDYARGFTTTFPGGSHGLD